MAKPLIVVVPHALGRIEARRRIAARLAQGQDMIPSAGFNMADPTWSDDRLSFLVTALGQTVDGDVDVEDACVRVKLRMPLLLSVFSGNVRSVIAQQGERLLGS
ncbi:polyhydroxyalkanoic acid synthase [Methylobacterium variabile]|jgi:hypothetical protein|uniref:Polyhydroxyalkanoic acid synthase n=1 Tax=Methylobacterium variabile TaxID=298794 RepID=A0A0J6VIZ8_9HYPH|nr:polyhydroxyalkanoic acid system family protein [Methylobacterium variabile]KMO39071.1 polyhydroxyalkanoic acid synthase [Methylobacterium variabile]